MACPRRRFRRGVDLAGTWNVDPGPWIERRSRGLVTESPLTSGRYEVLDKQLAQARTKTRFIRSPGLAGVLHTALTGPYQHVRGSRRTNGGAKGGERAERGGQRWREGSEETTRWVRRNVEYESRRASLLSPRASCHLLLFLYRVPPCAAFQHGKSLDVTAVCPVENRVGKRTDHPCALYFVQKIGENLGTRRLKNTRRL